MDDLDLFGHVEPEHPFIVHTITVTKIEYEEPSPSDIFGMDPIECEYTINHGACDLRGEECIVEGIVSDIGLHQSIFGVWDKDHRLEEKDYRVRGWTSKFDVPSEPIEYDAGIEEVEEVDEDE